MRVSLSAFIILYITGVVMVTFWTTVMLPYLLLTIKAILIQSCEKVHYIVYSNRE
jgi:hypothetical protein